MEVISMHGEDYYPIKEILKFIDQCTDNNIAILSIELYVIIGEQVSPYDKLQGFDGTSLYKEKNSHKTNVMECNKFIKQTVLKSNIQSKDLYYSVVLEEDEIEN